MWLATKVVCASLIESRCIHCVCCSVLQSCCSVRHYGKTQLKSTVHHSSTDDASIACVAVCCSVLQCAAVCCSVLHCVTVCCNVRHYGKTQLKSTVHHSSRVDTSNVCVAVCCSVLQCVAVCCTIARHN